MKKSVKIIIIILVVLTILVLAFLAIFSGNKKAITIEKFEKIATEKGHRIVEVQIDEDYNDIITESKAAVKEDDSYLIRFYVLKDNDSAKIFYNENKEEFSKDKKEEDKPIEEGKKNYDSYTLKSDNQYSYVARIDNTVIRLKVAEALEQEVTDFLKKLGY